ncbi:MAG TPA: AAA family ATPase [Acidothermales bacterium]
MSVGELAAELSRERTYLDAARAALARMRERTLALEAVGGNAVSDAYLAATLYHRATSLVDDPDTPLFFGRIDTADESLHIGRRHVGDEHGDPVVVDWRADVSRPFYRATRREPMGIRLRRRFGFARGQITAYEDEHLTDAHEGEQRSRILTEEIERPRVGPMRDIVATIQPEQDAIVRASLADSVCVQGAPGTGKTAVGLHRAAYLLYAHRERLARSGVLIVGPNRSFLSYIGAVLPALGELQVRQVTVDELVGGVAVRGRDSDDVALLKGDARMAEVLHRAVWSQLRQPTDALLVPRGSRRWRIPTYVVDDITSALRGRGVRYGAGRSMLPQQLAHAVLLRMEAAGDSPDDRVQNAVARSKPVRAYADAVWPAVNPVRLVLRLLTDAQALAAAADGVLDAEEQRLLLWSAAPRGPGSARWSLADAVLIDEARDLVERTSSVGHVVLDEAQDLSPMQLRAVGRRCTTGSATVLGDLAQGTTPWATPSWDVCLSQLGKPDALLEVLDRGYRVPSSVLEFATRLLPEIASDLAPPVSVRDNPGDLDVVRGTSPDEVVRACREALRREGSVGVIAADDAVEGIDRELAAASLAHARLGVQDMATDERVTLVPATLAKGLEFDSVVVVDPARIVAAEREERIGLRRLYVVLTRAVSSLTVLHDDDLPAALVIT